MLILNKLVDEGSANVFPTGTVTLKQDSEQTTIAEERPQQTPQEMH